MVQKIKKLFSGSSWEWGLRGAVLMPILVVLFAFGALLIEGFAFIAENKELLAWAVAIDLALTFVIMVATFSKLSGDEDEKESKILFGYLTLEGFLFASTALYFWEHLFGDQLTVIKMLLRASMTMLVIYQLKKIHMLPKSNGFFGQVSYFAESFWSNPRTFPVVLIGIDLLGWGMAFIGDKAGMILVIIGGLVIVLASVSDYIETKKTNSLVYTLVFACSMFLGVIALFCS